MPSIPEWGQKIKAFLEDAVSEWGLVVVVFLLAIASFGLGRLSALEDARPPVSIIEAPSLVQPQPLALGDLIVASRTGSAYYYPWCSGTGRIALANQVWFQSEDAARKAGYAPAKNCKGLASQ